EGGRIDRCAALNRAGSGDVDSGYCIAARITRRDGDIEVCAARRHQNEGWAYLQGRQIDDDVDARGEAAEAKGQNAAGCAFRTRTQSRRDHVGDGTAVGARTGSKQTGSADTVDRPRSLAQLKREPEADAL